MPREVSLPPVAPAMLESMRAIGYSFEAALADIIDNSVAAQASTVSIQVRRQPSLYVAIIDDGIGMTEQGLREAMRYGGVGPNAIRSEGDLGRFGLGLKTASLSQCRRLTVVTLSDGTLCGAIWDLDTIAANNDWTLTLLDADEVRDLPHVDRLEAIGHGTIVIWQGFDRATAGESSPAEAVERLVDGSRAHLSLAFHRYIGGGVPGAAPRRVQISINDAPLPLIDPFLSHKKGRQVLPEQDLQVEGGQISIRPFILPHLSRMSKEEIELAGGEEGLRREQGFYVYRNYRLITHGTWFRMMRQGELMKLARVRVDIPNSLDHLWALDVKKSEAYPPQAVRVVLRTFIEQIGDRSRRVFTFRGRTRQRDEIIHLWNRVETRTGVDYLINRDHPAVIAATTGPDGLDRRFESLLRVLEIGLPADAIYADMAGDTVVSNARTSDSEVEADLEQMARRLVDALLDLPEAKAQLLDRLKLMEPFSAHPELTDRIRKRLADVV